MNIGLVGVSCVGKTTMGKRLAERLGYAFFDLDTEIEDTFGTSIERLKAAESNVFRGWSSVCTNSETIPPLALYCVWSKQHCIGSQSHGTIPRQESLCAVR